MLAHSHGQVWNASDISRSLGEAHTTVKRHLDILCGALMVRQLPPWFENLRKRQVKAPKVYVRDSGLVHALLGLSTFAALEGHPKLGASWEGFVLFVGGRRVGIDIKYADAPAFTKSMGIAQHDLKRGSPMVGGRYFAFRDGRNGDSGRTVS